MCTGIGVSRSSVAGGLLLAALCVGLGPAERGGPEFVRLREEVISQPRSFDNGIYFAWTSGQVVRSEHFTGQSDLFGDFDGDGDVDLFDYNAMQICHSFSGPGLPTPPACGVFDADEDGDIDLYDVSEFWRVLTGLLGGVVVEAGNLVPIVWSPGHYYSGEPGTWGNNALNGHAAQAGYTQDDLWYEWSVTTKPQESGSVIISNPSEPDTAYTILAPVAAGSYVFQLLVTNLITLESGSDSTRLAAVGECLHASECDDDDLCTTDECITGSCVYTDNTAACDDGNVCTTGDSCSNGLCTGRAISCDDGKACTNDFCESASGCQHLNNTNPCDDGNACTTGDVCSGGSCSSGAARNCNDGNPCTDDSCSPATGCQYANNVAGCTDGLFCNGNDTCAGGTCSVHVGDPCVLPELCSETLDGCVECLNNAGCDDGVFCNGNDTCAGGTCSVHVGDPCTLPDLCNETTDACVQCLTTADCNDGNVCTNDACVAGSCLNTPNAAACNDGLFCNGVDTCSSGLCSAHAGDPCTPPDSCHEGMDACVK